MCKPVTACASRDLTHHGEAPCKRNQKSIMNSVAAIARLCWLKSLNGKKTSRDGPNKQLSTIVN